MIFGKRKAEALAQRERIILYKRVFGSRDGKEVLFDLMNRFHILNSHAGDPMKEGQRSVVLSILEKSHINLAAFDELLKGDENGNS